MRIAGYVRESSGPQDANTAFAQAEKIRRAAADGGHQLVAVCQDVRRSGLAPGLEGYRALVGIVEGGQVDGVIVASLDAFSPDKIVQEIIMWDLRSRGVNVLSAHPDDVSALGDPPSDRSRRVIRDVLLRVGDYFAVLGESPGRPLPIEEEPPEVLVELIPSDGPRVTRRRGSGA